MPVSEEAISPVRQRRHAARRWLVTGAAGFIGSNLVEALLRAGQNVVGIDNFATGRQSNLDDIRECVGEKEWARFTFLEGDIRDEQACHEACRGVDIVLHEAALGSVPRSIADPISTNAANINGFLNMLVAARDAKVGRIVYACSSSTYGDSAELPKVEERIGRPLSPYAITKLVNELYADVFSRMYGTRCVGLRYFNVFGPRQNPAGAYAAVIPRWIGGFLEGKRGVINGDGETTRDFCFVDNVVQANFLAALTDDPAAVNQVYNVAVGGRTTLKQLYVAVQREVARNVPGSEAILALDPEFGPFRPADVRHAQASIEKAQRLLGYRPSHDVYQGLAAAMPWYVRDLAPTVG